MTEIHPLSLRESPDTLQWKPISTEKQRPDSEVAKSDPLNALAAPRNSVHKNYKQNLWQRAALTESNPEMRPTYCQQCGPNSDNGHTETEQPLSRGSALHIPGAPPTGLPEGHSRTPSPSPQNTCRLIGRTPMHQDPAEGFSRFHWEKSTGTPVRQVFDWQQENPQQPQPQSSIWLQHAWNTSICEHVTVFIWAKCIWMLVRLFC